MSPVWSGSISTDDPATCIQDVQISASDPSTPLFIPQDAKLLLLSLVEVSRIPLYLAAGPSCAVSTTNEVTTRWLTEALLDYQESDRHEDASSEEWWSRLGGQSKTGILLRVGTENEEENGIRGGVTEVLLYAAVAPVDPIISIPPAPSSLTPPDEDTQDTTQGAGKTVNVFALPLCSNIISTAAQLKKTCPPTPTESQSSGQACFLPHTHDPTRLSKPAPQKRQNISTLFEDATQKRRKSKGRGGESISQAMAGIDRLPLQRELQDKHEASQLQRDDPRRKSFTRTSSMTPVPGSEPPRPISSGPLAHGKRSSLHRVESALSPRESPVLPDGDGSYAQQNKVALTKVVMAALRLHGLQQKKRPRSKSQPPDQVTTNTETSIIANEADDEYKLVYHQTFKAASFTFRRYFNAQLISQETMREVVDRLLTIFYTDPINTNRVPGASEFLNLEAKNGHPSSSPFDKPSSQAQYSITANGWNTPTARRYRT